MHRIVPPDWCGRSFLTLTPRPPLPNAALGEGESLSGRDPLHLGEGLRVRAIKRTNHGLLKWPLSAARICVIAVLMLLCSGCIPAEEPPQLAYTPGPPVVVTDSQYDAGAYTLHYPQGWRVRTGPTEDPLLAFFVAPDERALIMLATAPIDPTPTLNAIPADQQAIERQQVTLNSGLVLYAYLIYDVAQQAMLTRIFRRVVDTIRA